MRWIPLFLSPLPFNIDGFPLVRISDTIARSGVWRLDPADVNAYNLKMPAYSMAWLAVAGIGGVNLLSGLQAVMPFLTSAVVLPAYLLAVKLTRRPIAGFASGLFAAVFGSFLFLTSAAMKEAIGLLILPVVVLLFAERSDPKKRALAALLLLWLPLLHHLTTLLALGMVCALVVLDQGRAALRGSFSPRRFVLDAASGPALALPAWAYYAAVGMPFLDAITAPDAIALFLGICILLAAALVPLARPARRRLGRRVVSPASPILVVPAVAILAVFLNGGGLFAGALGTQSGLVSLLPAVAVLAALGLLGYLLVRRTTNRGTHVLLGMLIAPTAFGLFAFLRGLDPLSLALVYRSFDFLDYALAVLVGVGFAFLWNTLRGSRASQVAMAAGLLGLLLATTSMAWDSPAVFGVDNVTRPAEFQALAVLASLHPRNVTTDQRLADVGAWWFGLVTTSDLPILIKENRSATGHDYALVLERWTTAGAQEHPAPNVVLRAAVLAAFLGDNRVVYAAGPLGDRVFVVQILET